MKLEDYIYDVPDFPKEGILFKDITPLMASGDAYKLACDELAQFAKERGAELIVGPEARGFMFGCPVAYALGIGFAPVRKPGKLPREVESQSYDLEYGSNTLCLHKDAIKKGMKVVIIDDLLATGGTVLAAAQIIERLGGEVVGCAFLTELTFLDGRKALEKYDVKALIPIK